MTSVYLKIYTHWNDRGKQYRKSLTKHVPDTFCIKEAGAKIMKAPFPSTPSALRVEVILILTLQLSLYLNEEQTELLFFVAGVEKADWGTGSGNAYMRTSKDGIRPQFIFFPKSV